MILIPISLIVGLDAIVVGAGFDIDWLMGLGFLLLAAGLLVDHRLTSRNRRRREALADVARRAAQRDPYSTTGRTVLGTPRDWSDAA